MTVIARGTFSATTYRRIASLLAAVVAAMTLTTAHAPAAHAAELPCPTDQTTVDLEDGASFAAVHISRNCSDGRSYVLGYVADWACDNQGAKVDLWFYNRDAAANTFWDWVPYRHEQVTTSDCDDATDFEFSSTNPSPGMYACGRASSTWTSSMGDCTHF